MTSLIERIQARSSSIKQKRKEVSSKLIQFNDTLAESLKGIDVSARSTKETIEMIGPDDWIYGYLAFRGGDLKVVYRSTVDDLHDAMNKVPKEHQTYKSESIDSCPIKWLEQLSSEAHINRLLLSIEKYLESIEDNTIEAIESLNKTLDSQSEEVSNETIQALRASGSEMLVDHWLKARNSIQ